MKISIAPPKPVIKTSVALLAIVFSLSTVFSVLSLPSSSASAQSVQSFSAGNIISDSTMSHNRSMSVAQIQSFLNSKGANCSGSLCLKNYRQNGKSAAQIIHETSQTYNINPQVFIVTLQKEVGLVTSNSPQSWMYRTAMGFGCPDSTPGVCNDRYFGFTNQLRSAGQFFRAHLDNSPGWFKPHIPGWNNILYHPHNPCGTQRVFIENRATSSLYSYTPYVPNKAALDAGYGTGNSCSSYGNRNFHLFFSDWFGPASLPPENALYTCNGQKYLYEAVSSRKRLIPSSAVKAWRLQDIDFAQGDASICSLPNFDLDLSNLVHSRNTGAVFYIHNGIAYAVANQVTANAWGLGALNALPQVEGQTIHDRLQGINRPGLTPVITSTNPLVRDYYLAVDGKRYSINGTRQLDLSLVGMMIGSTLQQNTLPPEVIQTLISSGSIGYNFTIADSDYVFDTGNVRRITSDKTASIVNSGSSPTSLHRSILEYYPQRLSLGEAFEQSSSFYKAQNDRSLIQTKNQSVINNLSSDVPQQITQPLANRILSAAKNVDIKEELLSSLRLIACNDGNNYLIERNVPTKRHIPDTTTTQWGLNGYHFFINDQRGCDYPVFTVELGSAIRSRDTSRVYFVNNNNAYLVDNQQTANQLGLKNYTTAQYPQFYGNSIHGHFVVHTKYDIDSIAR